MHDVGVEVGGRPAWHAHRADGALFVWLLRCVFHVVALDAADQVVVEGELIAGFHRDPAILQRCGADVIISREGQGWRPLTAFIGPGLGRRERDRSHQ